MTSIEEQTTKGTAEKGSVDVPPCLYCGGKSFGLLYEGVEDRLRYVPGKWSYNRCKDCGSAILAPFPTVEQIASFYPPVYTFAPEQVSQGTFRRLVAEIESRLFYRPQYDSQANLVLRGVGWKGQPGTRLLDVGCGRGLRMLAFQRRGIDVHGMDFQESDIHYVTNRLKIPAVCCNVEGLLDHYPSASFDLISAFHVLEHVPDVVKTAQVCLELLKPGGWLVAASPLIDSLQSRLFNSYWIGVTEAPRHLSLPTQDGLKLACARAGAYFVNLRSDDASNCAGMFGLSLFPGGATTSFGRGSSLARYIHRGCAMVAAVIVLPWYMLEARILDRPAAGMMFAQKRA